MLANRLIREHLNLGVEDRRFRRRAIRAEISALAVSACAVPLAIVFRADVLNIDGLLAAVAILTGIAFSAAIWFWERSIELHNNYSHVGSPRRLEQVDRMRHLMAWCVGSGLVATAWLSAMTIVFAEGEPAPTWSVGVIAFLTVYLFVNVFRALSGMYSSISDLRS